MIKGVFLALGIMLGLALVPIVDLVGIPFGPFIGAYYGMRASGEPTTPGIGAAAVRAALFGGMLGLLVLLILIVVAVALTLAIDLETRFTLLLWLGVVVLTMYTATMAALGAMYSQLRAAAKQADAEAEAAAEPSGAS